MWWLPAGAPGSEESQCAAARQEQPRGQDRGPGRQQVPGRGQPARLHHARCASPPLRGMSGALCGCVPSSLWASICYTLLVSINAVRPPTQPCTFTNRCCAEGPDHAYMCVHNMLSSVLITCLLAVFRFRKLRRNAPDEHLPRSPNCLGCQLGTTTPNNFMPQPSGHRTLNDGTVTGTPAYMAPELLMPGMGPELLSGQTQKLTCPRAVDVFRRAPMCPPKTC